MTTLLIILICAVFILGYFFFRENTRNRRLKVELRDLKNESERNLIGKGKFSELGLMSAGIAHEISNPLSIIIAGSSRLRKIYRDQEKEKEVARILHQVSSAGDRIGRAIQGVRNYIYRDDDVEENHISLSELIDDVLIFCDQRLKNHGVEFRKVNVESVFVRGHKGQLEQVILNLINNSFDAIDGLPEKWIEVSAIRAQDVVDIYFKDSGSGIPTDIRERMMEPFYTSKKSRGSGLGLPLVKNIAEKHGGTFTYVEKTPHTTFLLELPASA